MTSSNFRFTKVLSMLMAVFLLANGLYFLFKGFFFQQDNFGYVVVTFFYAVAAVSFWFAATFKKLAMAEPEHATAKRRR